MDLYNTRSYITESKQRTTLLSSLTIVSDNLQEPVDGDDETDVLGGQSDSSEYEQHGDESGARHTRRAHAR